VVRERGQVRGVRLERGDAAAQRLTRDLDAVGRAKAGEPADDEPAYGMRLQVFVVDLLRENPPVARVAHRVERREPGRAVVGLVEAIGRLDVVPGAEYHVGLEPADLPADAAAKVEAVDEHAVRMFEDGQVLDADDGAGGLLLGDAQACRLLGRGRHAGLAAGEQEITDLDAARSPASDGRGRAVLHVVGGGDDADHPLEGPPGKASNPLPAHPSRPVPGGGGTAPPTFSLPQHEPIFARRRMTRPHRTGSGQTTAAARTLPVSRALRRPATTRLSKAGALPKTPSMIVVGTVHGGHVPACEGRES